uniref:GRIP domain-containing protein n=1 Tax=Romanomermis culicivorax TaxID=13658 RepID=A0A915IPK4_ROMCU
MYKISSKNARATQKYVNTVELSLFYIRNLCRFYDNPNSCDILLRYSVNLSSFYGCAYVTESHRRLVASIETEYQNRISDMENELVKQRDRMTQILAEKDQELESLRRVHLMNQPGTSAMSMGDDTFAHSFVQQRASAVRSDSRISYTSLEEPYMMTSEEANSPSPFAPADPVPSPMLSHYQKEVARRDYDLQRMRVDLRRLESQLVAAQHDLISKELTNHEIVEKLKDEIRNLETKFARQRDFGGPKIHGDSSELCDNIEYLKNVFQQLIRCTEPRAKLPMIKAICRALKFTPKEIDEVMQCYKHASNVFPDRNPTSIIKKEYPDSCLKCATCGKALLR